MVALACELRARGHDFDLMGFTTAFATFKRAGLDPLDVTAMVEWETDHGAFDATADLRPASGHPDISQAQTDAYFALGYRDLAERHGEQEARRIVVEQGRKAFEPVSILQRFLNQLRPSVIVSTTSPRFESAAIKAGRRLGISTIAVGDNYLLSEERHILANPYADHLTVIAPEIGERLLANGLTGTKIYPLGNPAFDALAARDGDHAKRIELRRKFGLTDRTVILWPLGGSSAEVAGKRLLGPHEAQTFLDSVCKSDSAFSYIMRPHPNWPVDPIDSQHGFVDASLSPEEALLIADVVCAESSTMGMQAALKGIPAICLRFSDYVIYPKLGWASEAGDLNHLRSLLLERSYFSAPERVTRQIGRSTGNIVDLIESVISESEFTRQEV